MPELWKKGKSGERRKEPIGKPKVLLQRMQKILHPRPENTGIF